MIAVGNKDTMMGKCCLPCDCSMTMDKNCSFLLTAVGVIDMKIDTRVMIAVDDSQNNIYKSWC